MYVYIHVAIATCTCTASPYMYLYMYEQFTSKSFFLVAGKPKKENALKTICLMLGPDFISDHITVTF